MTKSLRERLAEMTLEERRAAMRRTAEHDRRMREQGLMGEEPPRGEALEVLRERLPVYIECAQEMAEEISHWTTWASAAHAARENFTNVVNAVIAVGDKILEAWTERGIPEIAPAISGPSEGIVPPSVVLPNNYGTLTFTRTTAGWTCDLKSRFRAVAVRIVVVDLVNHVVLVDTAVKRGIVAEIRRSKVKSATHFVVLKSES